MGASALRWCCLLLLLVARSLAEDEHLIHPSVSNAHARTLPLPVLIESLQSDVFSRGRRHVLSGSDSNAVPWYSRSTLGEHDTAAREELQVTSVVKESNFNFGAGVKKWYSLVVGPTTYLVGIGSSNLLTLLTAEFHAPDVGKGQTYSLTQKEFDAGGTPLAAAVFKHWNAATKAFDAILVLSFEDKGVLVWYRIRNDGLEPIRSWPVHERITYLKVFQIKGEMKLLMLTSCKSSLELVPCQASADVFHFSGSSLDAKLSQTISLEEAAVSAEIGIVGDETHMVLALPAANVAKLYRYHWPEVADAGNFSTYGSFEPWRDLPSTNVAHAVFFHVNYKMYLAVGGAEPAVYRFVSPTRIEGCPNVLKNLGFVSTWLTLPVPTYRDEVILLAEVHHSVGSVLSKTVITLTWSSVGVFNWQVQPQCYVGGILSTVKGVSCTIENTQLGLEGAVALQLGDASVVNVLVPKDAGPSSLYRVNTHLQPILNPLLSEIKILQEAQAILMAELQSQVHDMQDTERILLDTLNLNGPNIIKADWVIEEIETDEFEWKGEEVPPIDMFGWTADNQVIDINDLKHLMTELSSLTKSLEDSLADAAVPENGEVHLLGYQTLLGGLEVVGNSSFDSLSVSWLNGESVPTLLKDAVRIDRVEKIGGTKKISNLHIGNIAFDLINGIRKDDLIFNVPGETVRLNGNLEVAQLLHVTGNMELPPRGTVGGLDLSEEILLPGKEFKGAVIFDEVLVEGDLDVTVINTVAMNPYNLRSLKYGVQNGDNVAYDTLDVRGQLQVERINGFLWSDIVERIVWKDAPNYIRGLTKVNGILKSSGMNIGQLNGLHFPDDFVLTNATSQFITGHKIFTNVAVNSVQVTNTVDGVPVNGLVTLSTEQSLDGELKLKQADITGDIKVEWAVNGIRLNQMQKSPVIGEDGVVSSNVEFSNLEVIGPIQIASTLGEQSFKDILQDVLVVPPNINETIYISGKKTHLGNLKLDSITVSSNVINGKTISDIARLDSDQNFLGEKSIQNAVFDTLQLTGKWDDVDVYQLNAEAIRLIGGQHTTTRLSFTEPLSASQLFISEHINDFDASSVTALVSKEVCNQTSAMECIMKGPIDVAVMRVGGNVVVDGKVCGWKLHDFEKRRMSRSRPQDVSAQYSFGTVDVGSHLRVRDLNGMPISSLGRTNVPNTLGVNDLRDLLISGGFAIDELYIEGNIQTARGVNNYNVTMIAQNAVKLDQSNQFSGSLVFEDILRVGSLDAKGPINGLDIMFLAKDAVYKSESVTITGKKTFSTGFVVQGNIHTNSLNGLHPSKIVMKSSSATILGPLRVLGNVVAGNMNVTGLLNGIPVTTFQNRYKLVSEGRHLLNGDAHFLQSVSVEDLSVMGSVKDIKLEEFFRSVVMKNEPSKILGLKYFINGVVFEDVAVKGLVNNISLFELAQDIVLHNDEQPVTVLGRVKFANSLTTRHGVSLSGNLDATVLDGCLVKEWVDNAVYLSQPAQIFGVKEFSSITSSSDLKLSMINAVDLSKVIPLNTPQDIPANVKIMSAALQHSLNVGGRVNNKILQTEYDNTLLTTGNQVVRGSKTFLNTVSLRNNLLSSNFISRRNITNVVTLEHDGVVNGPLKFSKMIIDGDLRVTGLISNIDVQKWRSRAFLKQSPYQQVVTAPWDVKGKVRYMESAGGRGLLDGENVLELLEAVHRAGELTRISQDEIKTDWIQLCHDTDALLEKARAQPFLFQQLEVVQSIPSFQPIASMHAFEALNEQFLAVSYANSCSGAMYRWNGRRTAWELLDGSVQNIGSVEKWTHVRTAEATYLITSTANELNCPYKGGNVWRFEPARNLRNVQTMDAWHDAQIDNSGHIHLLGRSGVKTWSLEDGVPSQVRSWPLSETGHAQFVPRSAGLGLAVSDGETLSILNKSENSTSGLVSRSANTNLPGRNKGNLVTMKIADGRKLVAVSTEDSDSLVVYADVATGHSLARIKVHGAHSWSVMELTAPGRNGQTLLAFIENEKQLRVVQYKGVEGFVDVTKAKLPFSVKEMIPIRLNTRGFVNQRHFLLLRSDQQVLLIEVEMTGDPLDAPPLNCNLQDFNIFPGL